METPDVSPLYLRMFNDRQYASPGRCPNRLAANRVLDYHPAEDKCVLAKKRQLISAALFKAARYTD